MRYIYLGIGSILAILFIVKLTKGKKYEAMIENLDSSVFPLNELYGAGFAWSSGKILKLKGKKCCSVKRSGGSSV